MSLSFDKLLETIAKDCIEDNRIRQQGEDGQYLIDQPEFTAEECKRYRELDPDGKFWGGYAYIDPEDEEVSGFIRLYSPLGSAKWCFFFKDGELVVDCA